MTVPHKLGFLRKRQYGMAASQRTRLPHGDWQLNAFCHNYRLPGA